MGRAEGNRYPPNVATMAGFLSAAGADDETVDLVAYRSALELLGLKE